MEAVYGFTGAPVILQLSFVDQLTSRRGAVQALTSFQT